MKNFLKVTVLCGLLLNTSNHAPLFSMEESDQSAYQVQEALLKRLVGVEGKLGHVTDPRLSDFVAFSLQQIDVMRQLAMKRDVEIEFLNALAKNELTFEQSRTRFIRIYEMLFNLQSLFESLKKENMLHVIVDVVPNLKKVTRYLNALEILEQKDHEFWPWLLAVDNKQVNRIEFDSLDNNFIKELADLFEAVNEFKNELDREQGRGGEYFDEECDDDFGTKSDRRGKYAKKEKNRKQRRSGAASKSQR